MSNEEEEYYYYMTARTVKAALMGDAIEGALRTGSILVTILYHNLKFEDLSGRKVANKDIQYLIKFLLHELNRYSLRIDISEEVGYAVYLEEKPTTDINKDAKPVDINRIKKILNSDFVKDSLLKYRHDKTDVNQVLIGIHEKEIDALKQLEKREEELEKREEKGLKILKEIKDREKKLEKKLKKAEAKKGSKYTQLGINAVSQFFGDNKQITLFSERTLEEFERATVEDKIQRPDSYGVVLNQSQIRVFEGIMKAFSDTKYLGHELIDKRTYDKNIKPINKVDKAYSNIDNIPLVRLTQADIISLSGYDLDKQRQGDKVDVINAINFLGSNQFCFYWVRLKQEKGKPVKDKNGDYIKEEVMEVGTLFRIKYVKEDGGNDLKYYEIHPSAVVLDQVNKSYGGNYFLLIPTNWRDEVKQITGKRASSYTYEFLFWLRLQYEQIRRKNAKAPKGNSKPFQLSKSWEDIAIALKMPKSMYIRNRAKALKIIKEAYSIAIELGYLVKVEDNGATDILYLNESYYPRPGELTNHKALSE